MIGKEGISLGYEDVSFDKKSVFLVTGGAGFIGSNLVEVLLKEGYTVRVLDDLSQGKVENIDLFSENENYTFIRGDIRDFSTCLEVTEDVDFVLHQAAWGSVPRSIEEPLLYETINVLGTLNMLEASLRNGVKKFVYASSSSVYGDEPNLPKLEGKEGNLLSPYALTKRTNEEYAKIYTHLYGLDTYGLRYFNVFGRRQDFNGAYAAVIPKFINQLLNDEQPTIYGDGNQSRDFTYIENVIEANLKACQASSKVAGEVFNIAYGDSETLIDVYHSLGRALNKEIEPLYTAERVGDIKHSHADISKARELLGYAPDWNFDRGIEAAIEWYKEHNYEYTKNDI